MAPERQIPKDLTVPAHVPSLTLFEEYEAELNNQSLSQQVAKSIEHENVRWIDLHPVLLPTPDPLPSGDVVNAVETQVSPDKLIPSVFILGSCEFSGNNLDPFLNDDNTIMGIGPHVISRYVLGGPISPDTDIYRPVTAEFVKVINMSYFGQSWKEVAVTDADKYVSAWCEARPRVTVLALGLWDVILGECG